MSLFSSKLQRQLACLLSFLFYEKYYQLIDLNIFDEFQSIMIIFLTDVHIDLALPSGILFKLAPGFLTQLQ